MKSTYVLLAEAMQLLKLAIDDGLSTETLEKINTGVKQIREELNNDARTD